MAATQMIRVFLRMALVLFILCLLMSFYVERNSDGFQLMLYSLVMLGGFIIVLTVMLRKKKRHESD